MINTPPVSTTPVSTTSISTTSISTTWTLQLELYHLRSLTEAAAETSLIKSPLPQWNGHALEQFLVSVAPLLNAVVLGKSSTDYDPAGASAALIVGASAITHLDKSHFAAHSYYVDFPAQGLSSCRLSLELATCGVLDLQTIVEAVVQFSKPDVVQMNVGVRGLVQDKSGSPVFAGLGDVKMPQLTGFGWSILASTANWMDAVAIAQECAEADSWRSLLPETRLG